ncbi:hypothetical protein RHMOL_Rhmol02G0184500 [Rhododendron molle]|uniref:Uncharacterized protein n=1 Tax=Rhododendron molle TaxID=49168 RepID=A0ACC0PSZ4_RHOML|nr:hypothetical protein RHMOL_Rhmol02G0184500 [Rhododendron molle]
MEIRSGRFGHFSIWTNLPLDFALFVFQSSSHKPPHPFLPPPHRTAITPFGHHPTRRYHYRTPLETPPSQLPHFISVFFKKKQPRKWVSHQHRRRGPCRSATEHCLEISKPPQQSTDTVRHLPKFRIAFEVVFRKPETLFSILMEI